MVLATKTAAPAARPTDSMPLDKALLARDIMTADVVSVGPEATLHEIAEALAENRISGVPVVDDEMRVIGIVSERDLIDEDRRRVKLPRTLLYGVLRIPDDVLAAAYDEGNTLKAEAVMTKRVITYPDDVPAREVAVTMIQRKINRIPITRDGKLVGIVSRADVLRAIDKHWHE